MSVEQAVFALAGSVCVVGSIVAAAHRDPRVAGAAFLLTLTSLSALYATLAAPLVAAVVVLVTVVVVLPLVVHLTVPAPRARVPADTAQLAGGALLIGAALMTVLVVAIAAGELPLNVSIRSTDGYDLAGLRDLVAGRMGVAVIVAAAALIAAIGSARSAGRAS